MLLCGLDFETTGLNLKEDRIIEVGLVHWHVETRQPVRMSGFLVKPDIEIADARWAETYPINGISRDTVEKYGFAAHAVLPQIHSWILQSDAVVAHNGLLFDKPLYENWCRREDRTTGGTLWIDTRLDLPEPLEGKLVCIAAQKGFLNPFPHRAVTDVLTMLKILDQYDLSTVVQRAKLPSVEVEATGLPFDRKDEAKKRNYYWDPDRRVWKKRIKECDLDKERKEAPFKIRVVENKPDPPQPTDSQSEISWV